MLSKNLNKPRRKPGVTTMALLSLLLGTQVAVLADIQYDYDYGFNMGHSALLAGWNSAQFSIFALGMCTGHFTAQADINECEYGGEIGYTTPPGRGG